MPYVASQPRRFPQRKAPGPPPHITDDVHWTRTFDPRERYRIVYVDSSGVRSERTIELSKMGESKGVPYVGVFHEGKFKTLRTERIIAVLEQYTTGHARSLHAAATYSTELANFPVEHAVYKVPTTKRTSQHWTVDLNAYTCTCPEKRIRAAKGYQPGQLGAVCPHMARAILQYLPTDAGWSAEMLAFVGDPTKVSIDNLT